MVAGEEERMTAALVMVLCRMLDLMDHDFGNVGEVFVIDRRCSMQVRPGYRLRLDLGILALEV